MKLIAAVALDSEEEAAIQILVDNLQVLVELIQDDEHRRDFGKRMLLVRHRLRTSDPLTLWTHGLVGNLRSDAGQLYVECQKQGVGSAKLHAALYEVAGLMLDAHRLLGALGSVCRYINSEGGTDRLDSWLMGLLEGNEREVVEDEEAVS